MAYDYSHFSTKNTDNVANTDRVLKLKPTALSRDTKMFMSNRLHAIQDVGLWHLRFEAGQLPEALRQRFTNFNQLMRFVTNYFKMRHIEVEEIID